MFYCETANLAGKNVNLRASLDKKSQPLVENKKLTQSHNNYEYSNY